MQTLPQTPGFVTPTSGNQRSRGRLRAWARLAAALFLAAAYALRPLAAAILTCGARASIARAGSRTLHGLSRRLCPLLGLRVTIEGAVPAGPVLLCPNHLSYIDVFVVATLADAVFVSRGDVAGWPGIGPLSRLGGTIYIDRARKRDAARAGSDAGELLDQGFRVVVFLEGRAGTGDGVLPYRSSLLEPACRRGVPCVAVTLDYSLPEGSGATVANDVAWADETPFVSHAMGFLGLPRVDVRVTVHPPRTGADRKVLAAALEADCRSALRAAVTPASVPSPGR